MDLFCHVSKKASPQNTFRSQASRFSSLQEKKLEDCYCEANQEIDPTFEATTMDGLEDS